MSNEQPRYVNQLVITFASDDQYNVNWTVRADDTVKDYLYTDLDELVRLNAPLTVLGIRALHEALCEGEVLTALERGNLHQLREYIRQLNVPDEDAADGIEEMPDDGALEGVVVH